MKLDTYKPEEEFAKVATPLFIRPSSYLTFLIHGGEKTVKLEQDLYDNLIKDYSKSGDNQHYYAKKFVENWINNSSNNIKKGQVEINKLLIDEELKNCYIGAVVIYKENERIDVK